MSDDLVFRTIPNLFTAAKKPLKALTFPGVKLSPASKYGDGSLYVSNGGKYGSPDNAYYGRIDGSGNYIPARQSSNGIDPDGWQIVEILEMLNDHPMETIAEMGRESGVCVYCARTLTDPDSVAVGYGPTCAGYHGLPHAKR